MGDEAIGSIFESIEGSKDGMVEFLSKIIEIPALSPTLPEGEGELEKSKLIKEYLTKFGFDEVEDHDSPDDRAPSGIRPNFIAWGSQVKVIRPSPTPDEVHEITVDVDKMMQSGDLRDNLLLQEGDIVYVPPTPLGAVGLVIQEVLFPFSPLMSAYSFPADVVATTNVYSDLGEYTGARGFYPGPIGSYGQEGW